MLKKTRLSSAIALVYAGGLALLAGTAVAQESLERVQITGSAIKRIESESAVPVTTLTQADIKKSGATTVTELIQAMPQMQGFTASSASVNGGGGGQTSAALHALDQKYTLVLLDGHRFAPFGGDGSVNLSSLPLDAIERVEVLTDGASALYGSDAIAGVVNFILKKNKTDGGVSATYNMPQQAGGKSWTASITKGFGDINTDGFNLLLTYSHDKQEKLQASQRDVSKRGAMIPFSYGGKNYFYMQSTGNTEPANITANAANPVTYSPYYNANKNCGGDNASYLEGGGCRFNYAATVQAIPGSVRDGGFGALRVKINNDTTAYAELALSKFTMTAQYAPSAQPMSLSATSLPGLWNTYVVPYLTANNLTATTATLGERVVGAGGRTDDYVTKNRHIVLGVDGLAAGWDYSLSLVMSKNNLEDNAAGGYLDFDKFSALINSGAYNPVIPVAGQNDKLGPTILRENLSKTEISMNQLSLHGSRELFQMPAGMSSIATGAEFTTLHHTIAYSDLMRSGNGTESAPASSNYPVGGNYGQVPFDAARNAYGVFAELALPLAKKLDLSLATRYDHYSKVKNKQIYDPSSGKRLADADQGNEFNATTYKASLRYQPIDQLLLRGSYGTGFKAPNLPDIAGPLAFAGSSQTFACPFPGSPGCLPGNAQYDLVSGGNSASGANGLKPEKSKQWTLGFRVDPFKGLSFGADWWSVNMTNQIVSTGIPQKIAFTNAQQYAALFINPYIDPGSKITTIAYIQSPFNMGQAEYQGVDMDLAYRTSTGLGELTVNLMATHMLKQRYQLIEGGAWNTDLGVFGPDLKVVFKNAIHFQASLRTGSFLNTLAAHYKSGYKDQAFVADEGAVFNQGADGNRTGDPIDFPGLDVKSYTTWDWQTRYDLNNAVQLTFGVKNLFDTKPPLSLQNGGGGNQAGYDGRYADPIGRTFYLTGSYKF